MQYNIPKGRITYEKQANFVWGENSHKTASVRRIPQHTPKTQMWAVCEARKGIKIGLIPHGLSYHWNQPDLGEERQHISKITI